MTKTKIITTTNVLIIISIIILVTCVYYHKLANQKKMLDNRIIDRKTEKTDRTNKEAFATGDICTVQINNLNPMFSKNFMQYDGKQIKCFNKLSSKAFCVGAKIKIDTQVNDNISNAGNGSNYNTKQSVTITNSNGSTPPENADIPLDPWEFENFFCLE
jgi:hypothetical protein